MAGANPSETRLRSGVAARLAGLPPTTLRVWERRYGIVDAPKSPAGQRLYTPDDVQRLRLLRELTQQGHAIGTIAHLGLPALRELASGRVGDVGAMPAVPAAGTSRVIAVGRLLAHRLEGAAGVDVLGVYDDLDAAERQAGAAVAAEVLLVHLPSLQAAAAVRVRALADRLGAGHVVAVYTYGNEPAADLLRAGGAVVRREPVGRLELLRLLVAPQRERPAADALALRSEPRRYDDEALSALMERRSDVVCECPRHVAEIVLQLASFERYSADCLARSPDDALLHLQLGRAAGAARTIFEQALERIVAERGLEDAVVGARGAQATGAR